MPNPNGGMPSPSQLILYTDALAANFVTCAADMGIGAVGETGTMAQSAIAATQAILGNGSSQYGIGNNFWQQQVAGALQGMQSSERYDYFFNRLASLQQVLNNLVNSFLPTGWSFTGQNPIDAWLSYLNGAASAVATPPSAGTLTATANTAGQLPPVASGGAPFVCHVLVGASSQNASLQSANATQVAIAGANNAYSYQIGGTIPSGVTQVATFRTLFGGSSSGPWFYDQTVAVTAGASYPAILILQGDNNLRQDISPPSWMQCALSGAAATLYALGFATASPSGGMMIFGLTNGMISPGNVLLGPANGYIGYGNTIQSALFGSSIITGVNTTTFTTGTIQTANNPATNLQGYAGAAGFRARCTTAFTGTATPTVTIGYYDAAHGWSNLQTASGITPVSGFSSPALGVTITFNTTAGRIIQSISETSMSGSASSGAYIYEGIFSH